MPADRTLSALLAALVAGLTLAACTPAPSPSNAPGADSQASEDPSGTPTIGEQDKAPALESAGPDERADGTEPEEPGEPVTRPPRETPPAGIGEGDVEVVITYAGPGSDPRVTEVVAYLPGVIEESGTCTATVVGTGATASAPAWPDVSSTSCGLIELVGVPAAGQEVVVTYASATSSGTSTKVEVMP